MLLGNGGNNNNNNMSTNSVVFRKSRTPTTKRKEKKNAISSARNSWSFSEYLPSHSASNQSRDSKGAPKVGTLSKGVDYIRTNFPVQKSPSCDWHLSAVEDRSVYGNPDGQSNHSTCERDDSAKSRKEALDISRSPSTPDEPLRGGHNGQQSVRHYATADEDSVTKEAEESPLLVRKGLLWLMRDHLFSRWHERYCLLTRNYLNCFKRASESALTPMGPFLFKINLADVISVEWLDKKGTAIVALNVAKEGRIFLKTSHELAGWFTSIQNCALETKRGRRQTFTARTTTCDSGSQKSTRKQQIRLSYMEQSRADDDEMEAHSLLFVPGHHRSKTDDSRSSVSNHSPSPLRARPFRDRSSSFDRLHASKSDRDSKRLSYIHSR